MSSCRLMLPTCLQEISCSVAISSKYTQTTPEKLCKLLQLVMLTRSNFLQPTTSTTCNNEVIYKQTYGKLGSLLSPVQVRHSELPHTGSDFF